MKLDKLQSVRDAQRKVVENLFQKIDIAKENSMLEFRTILKSISTKAENLESLNTKIIEQLEVSDIEDEIVSYEDYSLQLEIRLKFANFVNLKAEEIIHKLREIIRQHRTLSRYKYHTYSYGNSYEFREFE